MTLDTDQRQVVRQQVRDLFGRSAAWTSLPPAERARVLDDTASIVEAMVQGANAPDPYAPSRAMAAPPRPSSPRSPQRAEGDFGAAIDKGVEAVGAFLNAVNFPQFVSSLITGVFDSIVRSSIEQMKAYAELVASVTKSISEFRDQNVSVNQARDHLVNTYPNVFQINMGEGGPRVGMRPGAEAAEVPNFRRDLNMNEDVMGIDDDSIEEKLVPAARDSLALGRQRLLATMVLMGINRIIVTDGKINAKLKFNFSAQDMMNQKRTAVDYENFGTSYAQQGTSESSREDGERTYDENGRLIKTGAGNYYATGQWQYTAQPVVYVTDQRDTVTQAGLSAAASMTGEVNVNFRSETFPLEKMIDTDQMVRLQQAQSAGRAAPPPPAAGAAPAATPPSTAAPGV
jgi:hypothetical protein